MKKQNSSPEKLTDKAFSRLVITSVLGILSCIVCLCSTTWAYFTNSISTPPNEIRSAEQCLLTVTVKYPDNKTEEIKFGDTPLTLQNGTYEVTLLLPKDSASGYLLMTSGEKNYYSPYIERHESEDPGKVIFTLTVTGNSTVTLTPRWGIYSGESDVVENTEKELQLTVPTTTDAEKFTTD